MQTASPPAQSIWYGPVLLSAAPSSSPIPLAPGPPPTARAPSSFAPLLSLSLYKVRDPSARPPSLRKYNYTTAPNLPCMARRLFGKIHRFIYQLAHMVKESPPAPPPPRPISPTPPVSPLATSSIFRAPAFPPLSLRAFSVFFCRPAFFRLICHRRDAF